MLQYFFYLIFYNELQFRMWKARFYPEVQHNHLQHGASGDDDNGEITFWNINIDKWCGREFDPILSLISSICAKYILLSGPILFFCKNYWYRSKSFLQRIPQLRSLTVQIILELLLQKLSQHSLLISPTWSGSISYKYSLNLPDQLKLTMKMEETLVWTE